MKSKKFDQTPRAELRAEFIGLEMARNGKIAVCFAIRHIKQGYVMMTCKSPAHFMSYGAAFKGARRALAHAAATGKFPNMCNHF